MITEFQKEYIEARKDYIRAEFSQLNDMQLEAVMATEGPLLILAGAGSGKTTVLINRIANLLKYGKASDCEDLPTYADENGLALLKAHAPEAARYAAFEPVEPWRILAITFTNKAAGELKTRLERMLGADAANDIWACTFHSACVRILHRDAEKLGITSSFTIYDSADSLSVMKRIIKDMELDDKVYAPRSMLSIISRAKNEGIGAESFHKDAELSGDVRRIKIASIYSEYARRLFSSNALDFDDLLYYTVTLLNLHEDVRRYWQERFKYVLIDEYQDTNRLQYLFSALLAKGSGNICVVGDDDQSIYKFRGATIENILSFEQEYANCRTIRLEQNYRSTGHILDAANAVIQNNTERKGKNLWTNAGDGELVKCYFADNERDEAQYVASCIMDEYGRGGKWRDNAVLYRMNAQSYQFEYAFKRLGIPYRIFGGTGFFERAEIKDMLSYLNLVASPSDDLRLMRIINVPARGIGLTTVERLRQLAATEGQSMLYIAGHAGDYPVLGKAATQKLTDFAALMTGFHAFSAENTPDALLDEIIEKTGYIRALEESNTQEDITRIENVRELKSSILAYMKETGDESLEGNLANVALYTDLDNFDPDQDCVVLMTMHTAKGLEFPTVFLVGMEETVFPGMRSIGMREEMEEERRLCYVAITRAKRRLELVCARQRMLFGRTTANRVSRFVSEIPEEHIEKNIPEHYSYNTPPRQSDYARREAPRVTAVTHKKTQSAELPSFEVGDNIVHKAFGAGVITKMQPMGGDFLVEINFSQGLKRLMLRAAAPNMTKETD